MRTKPRVPERNLVESSSNTRGYCSMELELALSGLREKNNELVKRVAKLQQDVHNLNEDRFSLQREIIELKGQYNSAMQSVPEIKDLMESCTPFLVKLLENMLKAIDLCRESKVVARKTLDQSSISNRDTKTLTVKPHAVNGTVIHSPRISLKRLSDNSLNGISGSLSINHEVSNRSRTLPDQEVSPNVPVPVLELRRLTELRDMPSTSRSTTNIQSADEARSRVRNTSSEIRTSVRDSRVVNEEENVEDEQIDDMETTMQASLEEELGRRLSVILEESSLSPARHLPRLEAELSSSIEAESGDRTAQNIDSFCDNSLICNVLRNLPTNANETLSTPDIFSPQSNSTRLEPSMCRTDSRSRLGFLSSNCLGSFMSPRRTHRFGVAESSTSRQSPEEPVTLNHTPENTINEDTNVIFMRTPCASELGDRDDATKHSILHGLGLEPINSPKPRLTPRPSPRTRLSRQSRVLRARLSSSPDSVQKANTVPHSPAIRKIMASRKLVVVLNRLDPQTSDVQAVKKAKRKPVKKSSEAVLNKKSKVKGNKTSDLERESKAEETMKLIKKRLSAYMPINSPRKSPSPKKETGRPKRAARPLNLKDPSLRKKMRRS